jgi:hypothetical protein
MDTTHMAKHNFDSQSLWGTASERRRSRRKLSTPVIQAYYELMSHPNGVLDFDDGDDAYLDDPRTLADMEQENIDLKEQMLT